MPEVVTTPFVTSSSSEAIITHVPTYLGETEKGWERTRGSYPKFFPAVALPVFFSTASVLNDPRTLFTRESSVTFAYQKPSRRRISLAEARQIALDSIIIAERRRARFAELEGVNFSTLYNWTEQ